MGIRNYESVRLMLFVKNTLEATNGSITMDEIQVAQTDEKEITEDAFSRLENLIRKNDDLDYKAELASYREAKYGR